MNTHNYVSIKGLKLKWKNQSSVFRSFAYALFPTMEKSSPVEWYYLVTENSETENIRLHNLQSGEQLPELLSDFQTNDAKAVVLINIEDSYELSGEFVSSVKEVPFPLLIVKKTAGEEILKFIEDDTRRLYARVDAESSVDEVGEQPHGMITIETTLIKIGL